MDFIKEKYFKIYFFFFKKKKKKVFCTSSVLYIPKPTPAPL